MVSATQEVTWPSRGPRPPFSPSLQCLHQVGAGVHFPLLSHGFGTDTPAHGGASLPPTTQAPPPGARPSRPLQVHFHGVFAGVLASWKEGGPSCFHVVLVWHCVRWAGDSCSSSRWALCNEHPGKCVGPAQASPPKVTTCVFHGHSGPFLSLWEAPCPVRFRRRGSCAPPGCLLVCLGVCWSV